MRYKITGVNSKTGTTVGPVTIEAETEKEAIAAAREQDISPTSVIENASPRQPTSNARILILIAVLGFAVVVLLLARNNASNPEKIKTESQPAPWSRYKTIDTMNENELDEFIDYMKAVNHANNDIDWNTGERRPVKQLPPKPKFLRPDDE